MDARSLLRQKREAARVEHPYASYASGSLKCTVCGVGVKDGAAWNGHLGSKAHRKNLARVREEEEKQRKRPAPNDDADDDSKEEHVDKKRRVEQTQPNAGGRFPADFFSDPSRAPVLPSAADDDDDEDEAAPAPAQEKSAIDLEWEAFQASVINADLGAEARDDSLARATIVAEPELIEEIPQGFPAELAERRRAAQSALQPAAEQDKEPEKEETAEERQRRREREEKEEIMSRLLEEERLQEEADNKVSQLKARLELIKRQRAAKQKAK